MKILIYHLKLQARIKNITSTRLEDRNIRKFLEPIQSWEKNQEEYLSISAEGKSQNRKTDGLISNEHKNHMSCEEQECHDTECLSFQSDTNSNEFEMVPSQLESEDSSLEIRVEKIVIKTGKGDPLPEETNLIT